MKITGIVAEYNPFHNGHKYQIEKVKSYYDVETVLVPNYIGLNKKDIKKQYFNIVLHGEGNKVIDQLPKPNEKVLPNSTILIMLGD